MPHDEDQQKKRALPGVSGGEAHAEVADPAAHAEVAARNDAQVGALVGDDEEVPPPPPPEEEDNWWDVAAPRVAPAAAPAPTPIVGPTRHRRGAPLAGDEGMAPLAALPSRHRRGAAPILAQAGSIPTHRRGAPLMGPAAPPREMPDSMAARQMALKRAQQGDRPNTEAISGFGGHGGGDRAKPTVAPALTGADKDNDLMRNVALKQRQGVQADLAELGTGRAPGYRGATPEAADARAIVEDPRFAKQYGGGFDRASDGNAATRWGAEKMGDISDWWNSGERTKQAGKAAARGAVRAVPFVGSGLALAGAKKEHDRMGVEEGIAADEEQDPLTRATATGLAGSHRKMRNKEAVSGVVGLAKDTVKVATGGLSALVPGMPGGDHAAEAGGSLVDRALGAGKKALAPEKLAEKAGWKAGGKAGTGVNAGVGWFEGARSPHALRPGAIAPSGGGRQDLVEQRTDQANAGLLDLAAGDGKFGAAMLTHMNKAPAAYKGVGDELATARSVDPREADGSKEHNLKPSQVARMTAGEGARDRQKARMGDTLGTMTDVEMNRSFWEKSAGVDVRKGAPPAPAATPAAAPSSEVSPHAPPAPKLEEDEAEHEE